MKKLVITIIKFYQKTLSFDHGALKSLFPYGYCRFYPSCSEYTLQAVEEHGINKGLYYGLKRLCRCHPWHKGGYDPLK